MNLKERAKKIMTDIPAVFLALRHKSTPWSAKILAEITVGHALSPIDLIPDFIPVLGYLDDILLLPALIALPRQTLPVLKKQSLIPSVTTNGNAFFFVYCVATGKPRRFPYYYSWKTFGHFEPYFPVIFCKLCQRTLYYYDCKTFWRFVRTILKKVPLLLYW